MVWTGRHLWRSPSPVPCHEQLHLSLNQVAPSLIQHDLCCTRHFYCLSRAKDEAFWPGIISFCTWHGPFFPWDVQGSGLRLSGGSKVQRGLVHWIESAKADGKQTITNGIISVWRAGMRSLLPWRRNIRIGFHGFGEVGGCLQPKRSLLGVQEPLPEHCLHGVTH